MTVTFFGHRDAPDALQNEIASAIEELILSQGAKTFYVGNHGNFDRLATVALTKAQIQYPHIQCYIVLSRMPARQQFMLETIFPQKVAQAHYKNAVCARNMWMLHQSDAVVSYVCCSYGGAAQFQKKAARLGKCIVSLGTIKPS